MTVERLQLSGNNAGVMGGRLLAGLMGTSIITHLVRGWRGAGEGAGWGWGLHLSPGEGAGAAGR